MQQNHAHMQYSFTARTIEIHGVFTFRGLRGDSGIREGHGDMEVSATDCMQATFFQKEPAIQRQLSRDLGEGHRGI